ncbi:NAD(P)H-dependent oxidoreductase [Pseudobutyrivibrio sp.]|uniref:NAD(P)H-dependent oxidoreductase n=1 Tax=Pseudobutyrivibrio sp. TaxID=2014367 RepID=UPI001DF38DB6|nr:NAD(P)H-dependent oxidoreductase [Pseudobutyrivibrio sp.]MBE5911189.1 ACP phosphodiesterase [Pseudobutyrivibrio sp.]
MSVLFVNACVRKESRTKRLADKILAEINERYDEVKLDEIVFPIANEEFLRKRDELIAAGDFDNPLFELANQFAGAETIVIATPYWDLSFPAALKQYFEQINVVGITFKYSQEGIPQGLCKANKIYYVTTSGGDYAPDDFGYGYVKALAQGYYGIQDISLTKATGLDIIGADVDSILNRV